jgi:hypothetical protein
MPNTGGPGQKWNVRREWSDKPADRRRLYYSGIDRRIHLFGAREGWIQIGHFAGLPDAGELRMYDTDGNGYFDRWEVYHPTMMDTPIRVTTVLDEKARPLPSDFEALSRFYTQEVLPEALAANERFNAALDRISLEEWNETKELRELVQATRSGPGGYRRYAQDVLREWHYLQMRRDLAARAQKVLGNSKMDDLRPSKQADRQGKPNSATAWRLLRTLQDLDAAYGQGEFDRGVEILNQIADLRSKVTP